MKKKFFIAATVAVAAVTGGLYAYRSQSVNGDSDTLLANVEALTDSEGDNNPNWIIHDKDCTVSGELAVKLGLSTSGKGTFIISGRVDCEAGGNFQCQRISCVDLYNSILH